MTPNTAPIRILHVDDDEEFAEVAAELLEQEDEQFDVRTATSVGDGIESLDREHFDCIISDYDMPGQNGLEFLETVREEYPYLPFVLFTGKGSEELASEAISAGVTDYLQKGVGTDQYAILANRVRNAVEGRRSRHTRQRQLDAIEAAQEGISILDEDGRFIYVNEAYADLYGYDPEEIIGSHWELIYRDEDAREIHEEILPTVEVTGYWHGETIGLRADGSTFVEDHTLSMTDAGELVRTIRDITPRKERVQRLEETSRLLDDVLDAMEAAVWVRDLDGRCLLMNQRNRELFGLGGEEVVGRRPDELLSEGLASPFREPSNRALEAKEPAEFEADVHTAAGPKTFLIRETPLFDEAGEVYAYCAIASDISTRKEHERELQQYQTLVENVGDSMYVLDSNDYIEMANEAMIDQLGADSETVVGAHASDYLAEGGFERGTEVMEAVLADPDRDWGTYEAIVETIDGEQFPVEINAVPLRDDAGNYAGSVGVVRDVTERKERERTLERYRHVVNAIDDPVATYDEAGRYDMVNEQLAERFDTTPGELRGRRSRLVEKIRDTAEGDPYRELLDGARDEIRVEFESPSLGPDAIMEYRITRLVIDGTCEGAVCVSRDVTDRKTRERELERTNNRLEEFASVVSHDLRNPLNVAYGRLELAKGEADSDALDEVKQPLTRMEALIDDLLLLAKQGKRPETLEPVNLAVIAERCWQNVETVEAVLETRTDRTIRANPARLLQMLENLVRNAVQHGGTAATVTVGDLDGGFYVEDDGPGIPDELQEKVLQGGFSTNTNGTGLGLAIAKEIAEAHGWEISVTDSDAGGARFEISGVDVE